MKKIFLTLALWCISHICWAAAPNTVVNYRGVLVAEPCVIRPGDENVELNFGTVIEKYLYLHQRTVGELFEIRLSDCDLSLGTTVSAIFSGLSNQALPGLLALSPGSQATGIAIGIENEAGEEVLLNKLTEKKPLIPGENSLRFLAYVRGEPAALANKSISLGAFSAIATFTLAYE